MLADLQKSKSSALLKVLKRTNFCFFRYFWFLTFQQYCAPPPPRFCNNLSRKVWALQTVRGRRSMEKLSLCAEVCILSTIPMQVRDGSSSEMRKTSEWHGDFRAGTFANEWMDAVGVCAGNITRKRQNPFTRGSLVVPRRVTKAEQLVLIVPQKGGHMLTVEMDTHRVTGSTKSPVN